MSSRVRLLLLALVTTAAVVAAGAWFIVGGGDDEDSSSPPHTPTPSTPTSTPLADVDTLTLAVPRTSLCAVAPPEALEQALGAAPSDQTEYGDGQPAVVAPGVRDVVHEYGCSWTAGDTTARAWVFAPPVTVTEGRDLVKAARSTEGCTAVAKAPAFGRPSAALTCAKGKRTEVSFRGLFGDAWLTCTLEERVPRAARAEAIDRAGRWCGALAVAASDLAAELPEAPAPEQPTNSTPSEPASPTDAPTDAPSEPASPSQTP